MSMYHLEQLEKIAETMEFDLATQILATQIVERRLDGLSKAERKSYRGKCQRRVERIRKAARDIVKLVEDFG